MTEIVPRLGLWFEHKFWMTEDLKPLVYRVTKIAKGTVYYRPVNGGGIMCCAIADFHKYVGKVV